MKTSPRGSKSVLEDAGSRSRERSAPTCGHGACATSLASPSLTRRSLLQIGGLGLLGLDLRRLFAAEERAAQAPAHRARARSVIFLFQFGGPSHVDTFDMKPDAPHGVRSPHGAISCGIPGVLVNERLPRLARALDKTTIVRTLHHRMTNHNSASYTALTGREPPVDDIRLRDSIELFPAYGSVADHLAPSESEVPGFVSFPHVLRDGSKTPGQHASFLGREHDPLFIGRDPNSPDFSLPELSLPASLSIERLESRRELQRLIDRQSRILEEAEIARGIDAHYDRALALLQSKRVKDAFDLSSEPDWLRERYGRTPWGQSLILARRLVEAGVRFVNVYFSQSIGGQSTTGGGWDTHGFNDTRMYPIIEAYHLPITDATLPVFLEDLESRGLLDETLVVWMGEFGRTPKINANASRDHWPHCYTALLAGGGVRRGHVYGASDRNGAHPLRDPVSPGDLAATMFHLLGIDPTTELHDAQGRPLPAADGTPILDVIA
jgi:hypothetical protein